MIYIDGDKFACAQCIRGHRSSTCQHTARPLVMCRSRGRPSLNAGHRIAVTEAVQAHSTPDTPSDSSSSSNGSSSMIPSTRTTPTPIVKTESDTEKKPCCSSSQLKQESTPSVTPKCNSCSSTKTTATKHTPSNSCCSRSRVPPKGTCQCTTSPCKCSSGNPILLQATKRSFVDFRGGNLKFVGPYQDQSMNNFRVDQSSSKKQRHNPGPCCKSKKVGNEEDNGKVPLSDFAVFKTLVVNSVNRGQQNEFIPIQPKLDTGDSPIDMLTYPNPTNNSLPNFQEQMTNQALSTQETFNLLLPNGCTVECNCGPSCNCDTCLIHRTTEELRTIGLMFPPSRSMTPGQSENDEERSLTPDPMPAMGNSINFTVTDELFMDDDCQCPDDSCCCLNCIKHNIIGGVKFPQEGPEGKEFGLMEFDLPKSLMDEHDCGCAPEECECFNCAKHGIVDGKRVVQIC